MYILDYRARYARTQIIPDALVLTLTWWVQADTQRASSPHQLAVAALLWQPKAPNCDQHSRWRGDPPLLRGAPTGPRSPPPGGGIGEVLRGRHYKKRTQLEF